MTLAASKAETMDVKLRRGAQILSILGVVAITAAVASDRLRPPAIGIDDANIFFVYARNISAGQGFVFNPGGERVEGFTSLLWVLVCSGAIAVARNPEVPLLALNILLVSLTIVSCVCSSVFKRSEARNSTALLFQGTFILLLLLDFRYVVWNTITLMETALWAALLTATTTLIVEDRTDRQQAFMLAGLVALMVATRPEALVWGPVICGLFYIKREALVGRTRAMTALIPSLLSYVLTAGILTIFRLAYFGWPLPNTYYAKVSPSLAFSLREGTTYLTSYLTSQAVPLACFLALIVSLVHLLHVRLRDHSTLVLTAMALMGLFVPVLTGGDHFEGFRFYQAVYPILLLALMNCVRFIVVPYFSAVVKKPFPATMKLVGVASIASVILTMHVVEAIQFGSMRSLQTEFELAAAGRRMGNKLNVLFEELHPRPAIGTITVGGLQYAYGGRVVDLMGLNNIKMAHNGGDRIGFRSHAAFEKRTFYELKPAIVVPLVHHSETLTMAGEKVLFVDRVLKGLLQEPQFQNTYRLAEIQRTTPSGVVELAAWYDREFLADVARSGVFKIVAPP
jgi:arabinofuranosyltransferase